MRTNNGIGWIVGLILAACLFAPAFAAKRDVARAPGSDPVQSQGQPTWLPATLSPGVDEAIERADPEGFVDLIVVYENAVEIQQFMQIDDLGGVVTKVFRGVDAMSVRLPAEAIPDLISFESNMPGNPLVAVDWDAPSSCMLDVARQAARHPDAIPPQSDPTPQSPQFGMPSLADGESPIAFAEVDRARSAGTLLANDGGAPTGAGVTVAVIDSGVRPHPDLGERLLGCVDIAGAEAWLADHHAMPSGWVPPGQLESLVEPSADMLTLADCGAGSDPLGHGTHVAGIIAGDGKASGGSYTGIAPEANVISLRVLDDEGHGTMAEVIAALDWVALHAAAHDIRVVNLSLGGPFFIEAAADPLNLAVAKLIEQGIVVVTSAGNLGKDGPGFVTRPGNAPQAITVGSLTDLNLWRLSAHFVSTFSSRGPTQLDGYLKPDLLAPGNRIVAASSGGSALETLLPDNRVGNDYIELSGTSMASPVVAATAALMLSAQPLLTPSDVKARLMASATPISGTPLDTGAGRLDIAAALGHGGTALDARSPRVIPDDECCGFTVEAMEGHWGAQWSDALLWADGPLWSDAVLWADSLLWSDATLWSDAVLWADGLLWSDQIPEPDF